MILPDGAVVFADAGELEASFGGADSDSSASGDAGDYLAVSPSSLSAVSVDPDDPSRPLAGYGVVVVDGEVVPASGVDEDGVGEGVCDPVRKLKNFLTASLDPGGAMESFVVVGAVSHCWGSDVVLPELIVPIKYRPRGGAGGFAPPLTSPEAECLGLALVDLEGRVVRDDLCDRFEWTPRAHGADVKIANLTVCVDCALTGRASDGALFRLSHPASDTLAAMAPTVASLECDAGRHRPSADVAGRAAAGCCSFSPTRTATRWRCRTSSTAPPRAVAARKTGGSSTDSSATRPEAPWTPRRRSSNHPPRPISIPPTRTRPRLGLGGFRTRGASAVRGRRARLANDVQWWSRGVGPLAPGLPNDPYDAYVFAGSLDVLSSGARARRRAGGARRDRPPDRLLPLGPRRGLARGLARGPRPGGGDRGGVFRREDDPPGRHRARSVRGRSVRRRLVRALRVRPPGEPRRRRPPGRARKPRRSRVVAAGGDSSGGDVRGRAVRRVPPRGRGRHGRALPRRARGRREPGLRRAHRRRARVRPRGRRGRTRRRLGTRRDATPPPTEVPVPGGAGRVDPPPRSRSSSRARTATWPRAPGAPASISRASS